MRLAEHVAHTGYMRNAYRISVREPEGKINISYKIINESCSFSRMYCCTKFQHATVHHASVALCPEVFLGNMVLVMIQN
jgi:hypothetical protein